MVTAQDGDDILNHWLIGEPLLIELTLSPRLAQAVVSSTR